MCGMTGVVSTFMAKPEYDQLHRLGIINFMRGEDGIGMFDYVIPEKEETPSTMYWKTLDHPIDFMRNTVPGVVKNRWEANKPHLIAIHTRAATQGKIEEKNQHPFVFDNLIGMHNGTIHGGFKNRKKFDTDSETLYYNINKHGIREALKEIQNNDAAFALVWFDLNTKELNFIRNDKRPLNYYTSYAGRTLIWSSEKAHLEMCALPYKPKIEPFEPYHLYTLDMASIVAKKDVSFKKEHLKEAETKKKVYSHSNYETSYNFGDWEEERKKEEYWVNLASTSKSSSFIHFDPKTNRWYSDYQYGKLIECRKEAAETNVVPFEIDKKNSDDLFAYGPSFRFHCTEEAYNEKLKKGCAICGYTSESDEFVYWLDTTDHVCETCAEDISKQTTQHWVYTQLGLSKETIVRIADEYTSDMEEESSTKIVKVN